MDLKETEFEYMDWIHVASQKDMCSMELVIMSDLCYHDS
jgi:hypothetical protein